MRVLALALLVACGSDKATSPPAPAPPTPPPTIAADAGVDAPSTPQENLRALQLERDELRRRQSSPPFVIPKRDHAPRIDRQECIDNPLAKGC